MGLLCLFVGGSSACHPRFQETWTSSGRIGLDLSDAAPGHGGGDVQISGEGVTLTFLGVAGWHIDTGRTRILTGPLFTNPAALQVGTGTLEADTLAIDRWLQRFGLADLSRLDAILVGHAHYDHLMDVPWIAARKAPGARIFGSATTRHTLAPFADAVGLDTSRIEVLDGRAATRDGGGDWVRLGDDVELLALHSDHGPHFAGITLYGGERTRDLERLPERAGEWIEGETLAYLLRIDRPDREPLLLLYRDAVARGDAGLPPAGLGPVDLALLVPATFQEVEWHPETVIEATRPRHVILHHWEDFFAPPDPEGPDPVPLTPLGEFVTRLERSLDRVPRGGAAAPRSRWHMPVPGTVFVVR